MTDAGGPPSPDPTIELYGAGEPPADPLPPDEPLGPWYRRPGPWWVVAIVALVVLVAGGALLLRSDDEAGERPVSVLRFERLDELGQPMVRELVVDVSGSAVAGNDFEWLAPANARAPLPAVATTDATTGRALFRWVPSDEVDDPENWSAQVLVFEEVGAEESLAAREFECSYQRPGEDAVGTAVLTVSFDDRGDLRQPRTARYGFRGYSFRAGDVTTCVVSNASTAASGSASADVSDPVQPDVTETTIPPVTDPATTEPGSPDSTVVDTTIPEPTQPGTTEPGAAVPDEQSLMSVIDARPDLATLRVLIDFAGLRETYADPNSSFTLFAPTDEAFDAVGLDPGSLGDADPDAVRDLLLAHTHSGSALLSRDLLALTEIVVGFGGPQLIDADSDPPTVGFVDIEAFDITAANGVAHLLSDVLNPVIER